MVVAEDLEDAAKVLELPGVCGGVRLHKAIGLHPEKANLGRWLRVKDTVDEP